MNSLGYSSPSQPAPCRCFIITIITITDKHFPAPEPPSYVLSPTWAGNYIIPPRTGVPEQRRTSPTTGGQEIPVDGADEDSNSNYSGLLDQKSMLRTAQFSGKRIPPPAGEISRCMARLRSWTLFCLFLPRFSWVLLFDQCCSW